jgi:hypothetical protein
VEVRRGGDLGTVRPRLVSRLPFADEAESAGHAPRGWLKVFFRDSGSGAMNFTPTWTRCPGRGFSERFDGPGVASALGAGEPAHIQTLVDSPDAGGAALGVAVALEAHGDLCAVRSGRSGADR